MNAHNARLDALRGLAVLAVVAYHWYGTVFGLDALHWSGLWRDPASSPSPLHLALYPLAFGWAGVSLFFLLSGYLIHGSYLKDRNFSWGKYARRRFFRIYPAYFVVLVLVAGLNHAIHTPTFFAHLFLVHDLHPVWFGDIVPAFWSLAVEAQLYLLYPVALWLRSRLGSSGMLAVGAGASSLYLGIAASLTDWHGPFLYAVWWNPIALWPSWLLGAWLAEGRRLPGWVSLLAAALVVLTSLFKPTYALLSFNLAAVASVGLLRSFPSCRPLAFVGLVSYSVYLIHQPLIELFPPVLGLLPLVVLASVAAASVLYYLVERPGMRLGSGQNKRVTARPTHSQLRDPVSTHG